MANKIQFKRGLGNQIPELAYGEPGFVSDEGELYIGTEKGNIKLTSNSEIASINKQLDNVAYIVNSHKLFNENNISAAINEICKNLKPGQYVILAEGNYKITEPIQLINIPEGCVIDLRGQITQSSDMDNAIITNGTRYTLSINKLIGKNRTNNGLSITKGHTFESTFNIRHITNFNLGINLELKDDSVFGIQYCKFNFDLISSCNIGILFNCTNNNWINENSFFGGRIGDWNKETQKGLVFLNGNIISDIGYNNNKFYNIGFEGISSNGIELHNSPWNSFINCRMLESIDGKYIVDDGTATGCIFMFSCILPLSRIQISSANVKYIGTLFTSEEDTEYKYNGFKSNSNGIKIFDISNYKTGLTHTNDTYIIDSQTKNTIINTSSSQVVVKVSTEVDYEGNEIWLYIGDFNHPVVFFDSKNTVQVDVKITRIGWYRIVKIVGNWTSIYTSYSKEQLKPLYSDPSSFEELKIHWKQLLDDLKETGLMKV